MDSSLRKLLKAASTTYPLSLSEQALSDGFGAIRTALVGVGLLTEDETELSVTCPGCENTCLEDAIYQNGRLLVNCPYRDDIGVVEIPLEAVNRWRFSFEGLTRFIAQQLQLKGDIEEAENKSLWYLGKGLFNSRLQPFYLARANSLTEVGQLSKKVSDSPCIILWTGEKKHLEKHPSNVYPLIDLLSINQDKLILNRDMLLELVSSPVILPSDAEPFEFSQALQNGKLFVDFKNAIIQFSKQCSLVYASPEYFFLMRIMQKVGERVSFNDYVQFMVAGMESLADKQYNTALTEDNFHKIKSNTKKLLTQAGVQEDIIKPVSKGYRMDRLEQK